MRRSIVLVLALAACGGGDDAGTIDARVFGEQCLPGGTFAPLTGRTAVLGTLEVHVNASGLVELDTTAELLIGLELTQTGTAIHVSAEACAIEIPEIPIAGQDRPIRFEVPAATVASVGGVEGDGTLSSPDQTCATLDTERLTLVLGAVLDPLTAPLPEADANGVFVACVPAGACGSIPIGSNCACDQESDGKPGATLRAFNVPAVDLDEVYVTLRTQFTLRGEVFSTDLILGEIDAQIQQGILGCHLASGAACNASQIGAVKNLNPIITQQPGVPSTFRGVRIAPSTTCADIIAQRDMLFPR